MTDENLYNSDTVRLGSGRRQMLHLLWLGLIASGATWLILHYLIQYEGEFGPERNPFEALCMKLHGGLAFLALWFGGLMWGTHMLKAWKQRRRRLTGALLLAAFLLLILSGYLLYYATGGGLRPAVSVIHWGMGLGMPLLYAVHRLSGCFRR
jgi:hypothetical protein